jgi:hypothetical protein
MARATSHAYVKELIGQLTLQQDAPGHYQHNNIDIFITTIVGDQTSHGLWRR